MLKLYLQKHAMKIVLINLFLLFFIVNVTKGYSEEYGIDVDTAEKQCKNAGVDLKTAIELQMVAFETIDNMLPIKIGGVELGSPGELEGINGSLSNNSGSISEESNSFICMCDLPPPLFLRVGISISFWNNVGMIDTTSVPYCSPFLGMSLAKELSGTVSNALDSLKDVPYFQEGMGSATQIGRTNRSDTNSDQYVSGSVHFNSLSSLMKTISDVIFTSCFTYADTVIGAGSAPTLSEVYFWWQNDEWSVIKNPDALLVGNPIGVSTCMIDSSVVTLTQWSNPLLYWCMGTWGHLYPLSQNVGSGVPLSAFAMLASRAITERFNTGLLLDMTGYQMLNGICQPYPTYFPLKNDINIFPIFPSVYGTRFPLGYPSEFWGAGLDGPSNKGVFTWMVYQKRDCCFL